MIKIIKQEIEVEENLKKKIEFICEFANVKYELINGSIRTIENTNLSYAEPHKAKINNYSFLFFNIFNAFYVNNLKEEKVILELVAYIAENVNSGNLIKSNTFKMIINDLKDKRIINEDEYRVF